MIASVGIAVTMFSTCITGLAEPAQRPPGERDAEEHACDDGGSARIENQQDVLARQMHHFDSGT